MSLLSALKRPGPSGFGYGSTAEEVVAGLDLTGKTFLLTGCSSGLGFETLRVLTSKGARVLATARSREKAAEACAQVCGHATPVPCELADPGSVLACVEEVKAMGVSLDGIIANAGIMALPKLKKAHDYELQFFTNHVGHFLLVTGLLETLSPTGRVVMLSSAAHKMAPSSGIDFDNLSGSRGYVSWRAYGQSKLANLLFAKSLARRFEGTERVACAVHPGVIKTNLGRHMGAMQNAVFGLGVPLFLKSVEQGAATQVWAAAHPDGARLSGKYLADVNEAASRKDADNLQLQDRLWERSEAIAQDLSQQHPRAA
jgi:WW domain-containing oxidoreductase